MVPRTRPWTLSLNWKYERSVLMRGDDDGGYVGVDAGALEQRLREGERERRTFLRVQRRRAGSEAVGVERAIQAKRGARDELFGDAQAKVRNCRRAFL